MFALFTSVLVFIASLLPFSPVLAQPDDTQAVQQRDIPPAIVVAAPESPLPSSNPAPIPTRKIAVTTSPVPTVPFYSQFTDIQSPKWQKVGCGITDLTMVIDYYHPDAVSVSTMLEKGISAGAYDYNAGWIYQGLIDLSKHYGLDGTFYDLSRYDAATAFTKFQGYLKDGPVILSVHYKFDPKSTIPHLVVVNGIKDGIVYYNDPATTKGTKQISVADFLKGWKRKVIVIRPKDNGNVAFVKE